MLKSELFELLKDIADDTDINTTLQGVEGLIKPLDIATIGLEEFKNVLESNKEAKAYYQSTLDSGIGKGVSAFKEKTLPGIIEEELKKAGNKNKTPEQIELEQLKKQFEDSQAELQREKTIGKYTKVLKEKGLPSELVDYIYGNGTDETIDKNIESITSIFNGAIDSGVKAKLGSSSYAPPADDATNALNAQIASAMGVK